MNAELRTHLIPFVVVAIAAPLTTAWLVATKSSPPEWWPTLVLYLGVGVALFGASSLFHASIGSPLEESLNKIDHYGIHLTIAGTGTIHMSVLPAILQERVPLMLSVLWVLASIGVTYRAVAGNAARGPIVMLIYGAMASTVLPVIDRAGDLTAPAMCATYAALGVYAVSAIVLFWWLKLHVWWHVGTTLGFLLAGLAIVL